MSVALELPRALRKLDHFAVLLDCADAVHPNVVEVRYRDHLVQTMPRLRGEDEHRIDYRHVIGWLVRKPGAFVRYRYREDLYPSVTFRRAYDALVRTHGERADLEYLRMLQLAMTAGEARVAEVLAALLSYAGDRLYVRNLAEIVALELK